MSDKKIFNIDNLLKKISMLKKEENIIIGFTNGCFDLLHKGHLKLIKESKRKIKAMTVDDMRDTFVNPVISEIASSTNSVTQAGTYFISSSSTAANSEQEVVSATPCFVDTRANLGAYSSGSIPEALDQPSTIQNYYLHRNIMASPTYTPPMFITSAGHIQEFTTATFGEMAKQLMNISVTSIVGKKITYSLGTNTTNYTKGTGMADTRLNGSGNYQTRYVNTNDYSAQEFPNGTPTTINTYYLRLVVS